MSEVIVFGRQGVCQQAPPDASSRLETLVTQWEFTVELVQRVLARRAGSDPETVIDALQQVFSAFNGLVATA